MARTYGKSTPQQYQRAANKNVNKFRDRATVARSNSAKKTAAAKRLQQFVRNRATVKRNKTAVVRNAKAIKSLQNKSLGPVQYATSTFTNSAQIVLRDHPLFVHVTNPNGSTMTHPDRGAEVGAISMGGYNRIGSFAAYIDAQHENELGGLANGSRLFLKYVNYQIKFEGVVTDTNVTVHVIRQKSVRQGFTYDSWTNSGKFLPEGFTDFPKLAGFTPDILDRKNFEVIATRRLRMHSAQGAATEAYSNKASYMNINLKLNKHLKQLESTTQEQTGDDNVDGAGAGNTSAWGPKNQNPYSNIWMVISCDDTRTLGDIVNHEESVRVSMIRRCAWRDRID